MLRQLARRLRHLRVRVVERGFKAVAMRLWVEAVEEFGRAQPHVRHRVGQAAPKPLWGLLPATQDQHLNGRAAHRLVLALRVRNQHLRLNVLAMPHHLEDADRALRLALAEQQYAPLEQVRVV